MCDNPRNEYISVYFSWENLSDSSLRTCWSRPCCGANDAAVPLVGFTTAACAKWTAQVSRGQRIANGWFFPRTLFGGAATWIDAPTESLRIFRSTIWNWAFHCVAVATHAW